MISKIKMFVDLEGLVLGSGIRGQSTIEKFCCLRHFEMTKVIRLTIFIIVPKKKKGFTMT